MKYKKSLRYIALLLSGAVCSVYADTDEKEAYLDIYGHIMLDMGYQSGSSDPNWYDVVRPTKLPIYENQYGPDGNYFASVRQSRFGVKGFKPQLTQSDSSTTGLCCTLRRSTCPCDVHTRWSTVPCSLRHHGCC